MAPALDVQTPSASAVKTENQKSVKVLEDLLAKLSISKAEDEIRESSQSLATFINGDIEEGEVPTK